MNVQAFKKLIMDEIAELDGLSKTSKSGRAPVILDQQSFGRLSRMDAIQQQSMDLTFLPLLILLVVKRCPLQVRERLHQPMSELEKR